AARRPLSPNCSLTQLSRLDSPPRQSGPPEVGSCRTSMRVVAVSVSRTVTGPRMLEMSRLTGSGVLNSWVRISSLLVSWKSPGCAGPFGSNATGAHRLLGLDPAVDAGAGFAAPPPAPVVPRSATAAAVQRALHRLGDPGVEGDALGGGGFLGLGFDLVQEAQGDAADVAAFGVRRRGWGFVGGVFGSAGGGVVDHDLDVPAVQAQVDDRSVELGGDFGGQVGQGVHDRQPGGRFDRAGEDRGPLQGVLVAHGGGGCEVVAELADVRRQIHDVTMTLHVTSGKHLNGVTGVRTAVGGGS